VPTLWPKCGHLYRHSARPFAGSTAEAVETQESPISRRLAWLRTRVGTVVAGVLILIAAALDEGLHDLRREDFVALASEIEHPGGLSFRSNQRTTTSPA
jgi:hypothetical protein